MFVCLCVPSLTLIFVSIFLSAAAEEPGRESTQSITHTHTHTHTPHNADRIVKISGVSRQFNKADCYSSLQYPASLRRLHRAVQPQGSPQCDQLQRTMTGSCLLSDSHLALALVLIRLTHQHGPRNRQRPSSMYRAKRADPFRREAMMQGWEIGRAHV